MNSRSIWKRDSLMPAEERSLQTKKWIQHCLDNEGQETVWGRSLEGHLTHTLSVTRWKSLPYYTLGGFRAKVNSQGFLNLKAATFELFESTLASMEAEMRFCFYYVTLESYLQTRDICTEGTHSYFQRFVPSLRRYLFEVEERIEPGTRSRWPIFNSMAGDTSHDTPLIVRRAKLTNSCIFDRLRPK